MSKGLIFKDEVKANNELENLDDYSYGDGLFGGVLKDFISGQTQGQQAKQSVKQSEIEIQNKALDLALYKERNKSEGFTPLQITGIIAGSLMAITLMVVIIKKTKARRA